MDFPLKSLDFFFEPHFGRPSYAPPRGPIRGAVERWRRRTPVTGRVGRPKNGWMRLVNDGQWNALECPQKKKTNGLLTCFSPISSGLTGHPWGSRLRRSPRCVPLRAGSEANIMALRAKAGSRGAGHAGRAGRHVGAGDVHAPQWMR